MKKFLYVLTAALILNNNINFAQIDSKIASIINKVNIDSLYENLRYITGEKSVLVSSGTQFITSRYSTHYGNIIAEEYLLNRLKKYIPATSMQYFDGSGGNVIGTQRGVRFPNKQIIICAHFDDMPNQGPAPGADDNGSGTSAVLEAARILSQYQTDFTIIYALWDNEEIGLKGSAYYAQLANSKKDSIVAVINMDMIGWDGNNDYLSEIHTRNINNSNQIANNIIKINSDYGIGLKLVTINPGTSASDHSSFWNFNYSAILLIENYTSVNGVRDFHPFYHQFADNISLINKTFYEKCAKVSIGALAYYAGIQSSTSVQQTLPMNYNLSQNYPNPFNPSTKIKYRIEKESHVKLIVFDAIGREVATIVNQHQLPNNYEVKFESNNSMSSGVYFYILYSGDHVSVRKMVLTK